MQIFVAQCWRVIGAVAAHADGMTTFLEHFDELLLVLRQNPTKIANCSGWMLWGSALVYRRRHRPSASSSTIAVSSIHETGSQNFSNAIRNGWLLESVIAFGPNFVSPRRASHSWAILKGDIDSAD